MARRDHHPRQPRGIEQAFFLIEIPAAVLLRHQPALQPVGELGDDPLQALELRVEIGAQPGQFLLVAQVAGGDDFVEGLRCRPCSRSSAGMSVHGRLGRTGSMPSSPSSPASASPTVVLLLAVGPRLSPSSSPSLASAATSLGFWSSPAVAGLVVLILLLVAVLLVALVGLALERLGAGSVRGAGACRARATGTPADRRATSASASKSAPGLVLDPAAQHVDPGSRAARAPAGRSGVRAAAAPARPGSALRRAGRRG